MIKKEFIKFILVGILNTIVGYGLYALFIFIGFNYVFSLLFATILGVLFNFQTIGRIVFKRHHNSLVFRFINVYIVVFFIGIGLIKILKEYGFDDYLAGFIVLFPNSVISFLLNKFYVYRTKYEKN